jgi:hypothetical protein
LPDEQAERREIRFREARAGDDRGAGRVVDGDLDKFWVVRAAGRATTLLLLPAEPVCFESPGRLHLLLHNRDNLGCFRIAATGMADPQAAPENGAEQPASDGPFSLLVNLGGDEWTDPDGNRWLASRDFDGLTFGHDGGRNVKSEVVDHPVYGTQRQKLTAFRAVVPEGRYAVQLVFRETATRDPNRRTFVIRIEDRPVTRLPFRGPGMNGVYTHSIPGVFVKDGRLDVDFFPANGSLTMLNGIAIQEIQ